MKNFRPGWLMMKHLHSHELHSSSIHVTPIGCTIWLEILPSEKENAAMRKNKSASTVNAAEDGLKAHPHRNDVRHS